MQDKLKILIAEDEAALLSILIDQFEQQGFETIGTKNGAEGLDSALKFHPDLILADIAMPVMDGITMMKKLREDEWGKTVPVILLTNFDDSHHITEGMANKVTHYMIKSDWNIQDLVREVKEKLEIIKRNEHHN